VRKGAEKLTKFLNAKQQGRLDGFFTVKPKPASPEKGKGKGKAAAKDAKGAKDGKGTKRKVRRLVRCVHDTLVLTVIVLRRQQMRRRARGAARRRKPASEPALLLRTVTILSGRISLFSLSSHLVSLCTVRFPCLAVNV
jgi:flap endonuclease-1